MGDGPYVLDPKNPLARLWDKPLREAATVEIPAIDEADRERHRIYSLLLFALMRSYFNGNRNGSKGEYPWRPKQREADGRYAGGDYLGHNIGALAVDGRGEVIDFDFNHNAIFNSSVEHAEARLVRRVFSLAKIYDDWETRAADDPPRREGYSTVLGRVTVYTSLESCAQCSGIMALGSVARVCFLQRDPGTYAVGNIMRNLSGGFAPLPIPGSAFDFEYFDELNEGYKRYYAAVADKPFFRDGNFVDRSRALTGYLCTDEARDVFDRAKKAFESLEGALAFPDHVAKAADGKMVPGALTNRQALEHGKRFLDYAVTCGRRGTPH